MTSSSTIISKFTLSQTFLDGYQNGGIIIGLQSLMWKLIHVIIPVTETIIGCAGMFVTYRFFQRDTLKKHSVIAENIVTKSREPPRDIMKTHFFQNKQGLWIHHNLYWNNASESKPLGIVIFLHGHSEHGKRYYHLAEYLNNRGYVMWIMDHQGFGQSEGDRGHVENYEDYIDDILDFMKQVVYDDHPEWQKLPRFLAGHSMGSLFCILAALRCQDTSEPWYKVNGVVLNSAMLDNNSSHVAWYMRLIASFLDTVFPKAPLVTFPTQISTSFRQVQNHSNFDPLNYQGNVRVHQGLEMVRGVQYALDLAPKFTTPVLVIHGVEDLHASIGGARIFFGKISSNDKTMIELDDIYHQPLHEERSIREPIFSRISEWIIQRTD